MHVRTTLSLSLAAALALASCASEPSLVKSDCHSCVVEDQAWKDFSFDDLQGNWKGHVEITRNDREFGKKEKNEKLVAFHVLKASEFFQTQNASCASVPGDALVMNGLLWTTASAGPGVREYEAFVPLEDGKVGYGRLSFEKLNGVKVCRYRRLGRVMGRNREALPSVSFSDDAAYPTRVMASTGESTERTVEFLRFEPRLAPKLAFDARIRRPASAEAQEKPPLLVRVSTITERDNHKRGQWVGTEEEIFRLWRAE